MSILLSFPSFFSLPSPFLPQPLIVCFSSPLCLSHSFSPVLPPSFLALVPLPPLSSTSRRSVHPSRGCEGQSARRRVPSPQPLEHHALEPVVQRRSSPEPDLTEERFRGKVRRAQRSADDGGHRRSLHVQLQVQAGNGDNVMRTGGGGMRSQDKFFVAEVTYCRGHGRRNKVENTFI